MSTTEHFDAIVIGAGISGMYQLYRLRELGLSVRAFEAGTDVGGTWYWNRYPGARFDSESYSYGYSWSPELLKDWEWSEHFAGQPEVLRYLQHVADRFDLRKDIRFERRVRSAIYDETTRRWNVETDEGETASARFLVTGVGILSTHQMPDIPGIDRFRGRSFHTSRWPHEPVDLAGKRVGVIGTGATGVQVIQTIASEVGHLFVFQRSPNWCAPLRNGPIDAETQKQIQGSYPEIFEKTRQSFAGFIHDFDPRSALELPPEERRARYEELWAGRGFGKWLGNFQDLFTDEAAAATMTEFVAEKIRERVKNPAIAEKLIPKDHPFGTKRVPLESGYYEVYNRDDVTLVDVRESPIESITESGVRTRDAAYELDVIIYATGFDAVTGSFTQMDLRGEGGQRISDKWLDGPRTYLGLQTVGFPNLFTLVGPHNGSTFCNLPRCIEQNVEWVTECIRFMRERGYERIAPTREAEDAWTAHVAEAAEGTLLNKVPSWFSGANTPGKKRVFLMYAGGPRLFREKCEDVAAKGYHGFEMA